MSDAENVTRENAREFATAMNAGARNGWSPCGIDGCVYCEEVTRYRAVMTAKTDDEETAL